MKSCEDLKILNFVFEREKLEQAKTWTSYHDGYPDVLSNMNASAERAIQEAGERGDSLTEKIRLCGQWAAAVRVMAVIGVRDPELAFLVSDLSRSGTWLLEKGILIHGEKVVADVINTLLESSAPEMNRLTTIITAPDPYRTAREEGTAYVFSTETDPRSQTPHAAPQDFSQRLSHVLDLRSSKEEKIDQLFFDIRRDILKTIEQKKIDVDELSFALGVGRDSLICSILHRIDDFSFYLEAISLVETWDPAP